MAGHSWVLHEREEAKAMYGIAWAFRAGLALRGYRRSDGRH